MLSILLVNCGGGASDNGDIPSKSFLFTNVTPQSTLVYMEDTNQKRSINGRGLYTILTTGGYEKVIIEGEGKNWNVDSFQYIDNNSFFTNLIAVDDYSTHQILTTVVFSTFSFNHYDVTCSFSDSSNNLEGSTFKT